MKLRLLFAILLIIVLALIVKYGAAGAAPIAYRLPPETAAFKPGLNLDGYTDRNIKFAALAATSLTIGAHGAELIRLTHSKCFHGSRLRVAA